MGKVVEVAKAKVDRAHAELARLEREREEVRGERDTLHEKHERAKSRISTHSIQLAQANAPSSEKLKVVDIVYVGRKPYLQ